MSEFYGIHGYYGTQYRSRPLARPVHCHDRGEVHYRGGQVMSVSDGVALVRALLEEYLIGERAVPVALFEQPPTVGDAVILRMTGTSADTYVVTRVRGGRPTYHGSDQAAAVARGDFWPALLNGHVRGVPVYQDGGN